MTDSSLQFWKNLRALGNNPPLLLYLCTLEILPSWIFIFLILYLLRLPIPLSLLLIFFLPLLMFPRPSILLQSILMSSIIFLSAFIWLPLDLSGRIFLLYLLHCLDPLLYMLNFSLSQNTFFSFWKHSIVFPILKTRNPSSPSFFHSISLASLLSKLFDFICFLQFNAFISNFIIISFPPVSQIFVDLITRQNCFTFLTSCFMISTTVALLPSLRWTKVFRSL